MGTFFTPPNLGDYALKTDIQQNFVTSSIITQAQMWATYPPGPAYRGRYCRVSDMWNIVDGVYRCTYNGRIYYWEPTTQNQLVGALTPTGSMTIQPMLSSPIIELIGAGPPALTTWGITIGTDNIVPGLVKEVRGSFFDAPRINQHSRRWIGSQPPPRRIPPHCFVRQRHGRRLAATHLISRPPTGWQGYP